MQDGTPIPVVTPHVSADRPTADELRAIARRWMEEVWQQKRLDTFEELHSPDFIDHSPAGRDPRRDAYRSGVVEMFSAFPDFFAVIEDLVVDEQSAKVAIRWTATGTHSGPFLGVQPSGRRIHFCGIEIIRIQDGRIYERWGEWDALALIEQISEA